MLLRGWNTTVEATVSWPLRSWLYLQCTLITNSMLSPVAVFAWQQAWTPPCWISPRSSECSCADEYWLSAATHCIWCSAEIDGHTFKIWNPDHLLMSTLICLVEHWLGMIRRLLMYRTAAAKTMPWSFWSQSMNIPQLLYDAMTLIKIMKSLQVPF